jgi:tetratricopeptide (TPR) repeat protein
MLQKLNPFGHLTIGYSLNNIGFCYENLNKLEVALYYFQQALIIYNKFLPVEDSLRVNIKINTDRISGKK